MLYNPPMLVIVPAALVEFFLPASLPRGSMVGELMLRGVVERLGD
jgi:hypothetical protein